MVMFSPSRVSWYCIAARFHQPLIDSNLGLKLLILKGNGWILKYQLVAISPDCSNGTRNKVGNFWPAGSFPHLKCSTTPLLPTRKPSIRVWRRLKCQYKWVESAPAKLWLSVRHCSQIRQSLLRKVSFGYCRLSRGTKSLVRISSNRIFPVGS